MQPLAVSTARLVEQQADLACDYRGINPDELSTRLVVPALFQEHDLQTSTLCVWSTGVSPPTASVTYNDDLIGGGAVAPNAVLCLDQGAEGHAAGWAGGAEIEAGEPLGAVVRVLAGSGIVGD